MLQAAYLISLCLFPLSATRLRKYDLRFEMTDPFGWKGCKGREKHWKAEKYTEEGNGSSVWCTFLVDRLRNRGTNRSRLDAPRGCVFRTTWSWLLPLELCFTTLRCPASSYLICQIPTGSLRPLGVVEDVGTAPDPTSDLPGVSVTFPMCGSLHWKPEASGLPMANGFEHLRHPEKSLHHHPFVSPVWLWEARSRPGCQGPQRKYAGYLSTTSWKLKVSGSRVIREMMMKKEKKWMEKSKRSEATLTTDDTCACNMGWMRTWANAVCDHLNKEKQSRDADTNNQQERLQKQTSSAVVQSTASTSHWLMYSWVSTCFRSFNMLLGLSLCVPNSLVVNAPNLFTFWPVREFLVEIHTSKMDLWGVVFTVTTPCKYFFCAVAVFASTIWWRRQAMVIFVVRWVSWELRCSWKQRLWRVSYQQVVHAEGAQPRPYLVHLRSLASACPAATDSPKVMNGSKISFANLTSSLPMAASISCASRTLRLALPDSTAWRGLPSFLPTQSLPCLPVQTSFFHMFLQGWAPTSCRGSLDGTISLSSSRCCIYPSTIPPMQCTRTSEVLSTDGKQRVSRSIMSCRKLICGISFNYDELHQESLHCHQLEKELDDWCQYWYFQNGTGLSCCSPDSWCRRFNVVNASLKSERSLTGPGFSRIIERHPPILSVSKVLCLRHMIREIFLRKFVHLDTDFFSSIMFELRFTKCRIFQETIVNPFKMPFDASLFQIMSLMIVSLFWSFPISMAMRTSLLNDIVRDWEKVQCILNGASAGFTFFQEMPASAIDDALTPVQQAFFALRFRICLEQLKQLYITHVLNHLLGFFTKWDVGIILL